MSIKRNIYAVTWK